MPAAHTRTQVCTGHQCFPPRPAVQGSPTVFVGNLNALRIGDMYASHICDDSEHAGAAAGGSSTVFFDNKKAVRVGDPVSCGSSALEGHASVQIGG